ncbi:MAG: histidine phosphatase family protein [Parvibaculum sp.]|nr:histidine phosphatase family protein [Parvibaculum sp.]
MKRLCLMRHAKSDWSDPASDDFSRALNERGEIAANFMADYIAHSPYRPDYVICSTARRASQTCEPLANALGKNVPVIYDDTLYHAMPDVLIAHARSTPESVQTLLIVAHNPGLVLLAMALARNPEDEIALRVANGVPTGGFMVFDFPDAQNWDDVSEGKAETIFFGRPRDLMHTAKG